MHWNALLAFLRFGDHAVDAEHDLAKKDGHEKHRRALRISAKARGHCRYPPHDGGCELNLPAKNQGRGSIGHAEDGRYYSHKDMWIVQSSTEAEAWKEQRHRNSQSDPDRTDCPAQGGLRMFASPQGRNPNGNNQADEDTDRPSPRTPIPSGPGDGEIVHDAPQNERPA